MKPLLKACVCCELSTGSVVIAWFDIVTYFIGLVLILVSMIFPPYHQPEGTSELQKTAMGIIVVCYCTVGLIASICLFVGVAIVSINNITA